MMSNLLVLSANCQGLTDRKKHVDVVNYLLDKNHSILCLQDTHWTSKDEKEIKTIWKGECYLNGNKSNARGVAILINNNFEYSINSVYRDTAGNVLTLDMLINGLKIKILNVYAPNTDSPEFSDALGTNIQNGEQDHTLICGV